MNFIKHKRFCLLILLSAAIFIEASNAASEGANNHLGRFISICTKCHGKDGNSASRHTPIIAGLHKTYLIKQLRDFRKNLRHGKEMNAIAQTIPDDYVLQALAEYFSLQKIKSDFPRKKTIIKKEAISLGKEIYIGKRIDYGIPGCSSCHGKNGKGDSKGKYPGLVGQPRAYIIEQMKLFRLKERTNDSPPMMRNIAMVMDDEDIEAVAAYIASIIMK